MEKKSFLDTVTAAVVVVALAVCSAIGTIWATQHAADENPVLQIAVDSVTKIAAGDSVSISPHKEVTSLTTSDTVTLSLVCASDFTDAKGDAVSWEISPEPDYFQLFDDKTKAVFSAKEEGDYTVFVGVASSKIECKSNLLVLRVGEKETPMPKPVPTPVPEPDPPKPEVTQLTAVIVFSSDKKEEDGYKEFRAAIDNTTYKNLGPADKYDFERVDRLYASKKNEFIVKEASETDKPMLLLYDQDWKLIHKEPLPPLVSEVKNAILREMPK